MEHSKPTVSVNLLSQDAFSSSLVGKVLLWALSVGRYIVVFTELIVILSFLSRFKLDRDLTDLNSDIAKQKAVIESYGDLEIKVRRIQSQLEIVRQKQSLPSPKKYLETLESLMPAEVRLEQLSLQENSLSLSAVSVTSRGIGQLVMALSQEPTISNISLSSIETAEDKGGVTFQLKANLGEEKQEKKTTPKQQPKTDEGI